MSVLTIHHQTIYRYRTPMAFGPHRLMLRPRESHALRLYQHELAITPAAVVTWAHDVAGNSVATASFSEPSDTLTIDSAATLSIDVDRWPVFDIAASAQRFPFLLSEDEMTDLGALRLQAYLDSAGRVREWAQGFVAGAGWITFDPTNRSVGGFNLIPVAMARHISQAVPVSGSFAGDASAFLGLEVTVTAAEGEWPGMAS